MAEKIGVSEALERIERHVGPLSPRMIVLDARAQGAVLAQDIMAAADAPRFDCSAMDGFAVASSHAIGATPEAPARFALVGDIPASDAPGELLPSTAAPISTGAPIPIGADAVVARERCRVAGGKLFVSEPVLPGRNIRPQGEDMRAGSKVASAGTALSPVLIGALLAYGVTQVVARPFPRVMILSTGSEFTAGDHPGLARRIDSNGPMIGAMCRSLGLEVDVSEPVPDALDQLYGAIEAYRTAPSAGLILSTGGVSVGSHDLVREALAKIGARIIFHGVAMRPGKPILFALMPDGRPFFGLPGNPVAALVGFRFFVLAAIRRQMGLSAEAGILIEPPAIGRDDVTLFLRGKRQPASKPAARPLASQKSHVLSSVLDADCWIRLDRCGAQDRALLYDLMARLD